ncbi:MAG: hypothetical protein JHC84_05235 [Solirubrobacteraceae bacterium]|nr:hypothetical protein [Solirubrobacteraceae bacterium]
MQLPSFAEPAPELVPVQVVAEWPEMTFLENLAAAPDGAFWITHYVGGEVYRVDPAAGGAVELVAKTEGFHPTGIAFAADGSAVLAGHRQPMFEARPPEAQDGFWQLRPRGAITHIVDAPGARFLNGLTPAGGDRFYAADSISSQVWEVDLAAGTATVALHHELLGPLDVDTPLPAANGIKVLDRWLYVSNWVKSLIVRSPIRADGTLGEPEIVAEDLVVDDFAFSADGSLFGATHMATVVRLDSDGKTRTVGGPEQLVAGCTATAFRPGDDGLYVITDGGVVANEPEPARLVRLAVGRSGAPLPG